MKQDMFICINWKTCTENCPRKYPFIADHIYTNFTPTSKFYFYCGRRYDPNIYHIKYNPEGGD